MRRCDAFSRREFLRVGGLSALGLGLTDALRLSALGDRKNRLRNCILIWLDGGPSHLDTFDLKPDAPAEVRGDFQPIDTRVPGIRLCEQFRQLATQTDKVCIIRSLTSEQGEHNLGAQYMLTGSRPSPVLEFPSFGSVMAHHREGKPVLPSYIAVPMPRYTPAASNGYLPASCKPFAVAGDPNQANFRILDLDGPPDLSAPRLERRRQFLTDLDQFSRHIEASQLRQAGDTYLEQAYQMILSPEAKKAFDLSAETPELRQNYGRHRLGQSCLLARRLVESGCPFVTVTDYGWDMHQQISRALKEGPIGNAIPRLDRALSALLGDLSGRGLLSETLVAVMGEFGRTPKLNTSAGRDHWPRAFSVLLAGGGVKMGQVVGASDSRGESPAERPVPPSDLARTIYTLLGIDPDRELHTADGRPVPVCPPGNVIRECLA